MYQRTRDLVLHWLKVPPEPQPPAGAAASLRIFRAGKNYLKLRLFAWAAAETFALAGIVFWTVVLIEVEGAARAQRPTATAATPPAASSPAVETGSPPPEKSAAKSARRKSRNLTWAEFKQGLIAIAARLPPWSFPLIWAVKIGGILIFLGQIPFT